MLSALVDGRDLDRDQAGLAMADILSGVAGPTRIAALVVGLAAKGETSEELTGLATAMREAAEPLSLPDHTIDIVGTGGSKHRRAHALNVSTMASVVAAAAGAVVCKHGNRRASSTSGSFDFLEAVGINFDLSPDQLASCVEEVGLGFAFARTYHPAMRFAGPVRADLGIPTVFNILGPLAHPGRLTRQVVGVATEDRARSLAEVLHQLGSESAWVVTGHDGLDELTLTGPSTVWQVSPEGLERFLVDLDDVGLGSVSAADLAGGDAADNARIFDTILSGKTGAHRDIVILNAGAGLVVAGQATTLSDGVAAAAAAIDDGRAADKLAQLRATSKRISDSA